MPYLFFLFNLFLLNKQILAQTNCTISLNQSNFSTSTDAPVGQSFTACQTGTFSSLSVWHGAFNNDGANVTLSIYAGESVTNPIYTQFIGDLPGVTLFNPKRTIDLTSPVTVETGQQYTFVFTGSLALVNFQLPGDVYEGGRRYTSSGFDETGDDYTFEISITPSIDMGCKETVALNNETASGDYVASKTITTSGIVQVIETAIFKAGESILLQAGFHAQTNSSFLATIADCETSNTFKENFIAVERTNSITPPTQLEQDLKIVPNPIQSTATIYYELAASSLVSIDLYTLTGKKLMPIVNPFRNSAGSHEFPIDLSDLNKGIYFLVLKTEMGITPQKIIVH